MKHFLNQKNARIVITAAISATFVIMTFQNCSGLRGNNATTNSSQSIGGGGGGTGGTTNAIVVGQGQTVSGQGTVTCPTATSIVNKLQNALGVSIASGNCSKAYTTLVTNMPQTSNCTQANGFDAAQLLIYACCSDLTTGGTPKAQSVYNVNLKNTVAQNQTALVSAGLTMLNAYTGGVAGSSNATSGINTALTTLLTSATPPSTSTVAFMDVCIAASSAGALLISN